MYIVIPLGLIIALNVSYFVVDKNTKDNIVALMPPYKTAFDVSTNITSYESTTSLNMLHISPLHTDYPEIKEVNTTYVIDSGTLQIHFWTRWIDANWWFLPDTSVVDCGDVKCQYTHNKTLANVSHAVLFFLSPTTYAQYKQFKYARPKYRQPGQYWIAHFHGPPYFGVFQGMEKLNGVFNLSSSYHHKSDVRTPYGSCLTLENSEVLKSNYAVGKQGLVSWFVSHCKTVNGREDFVMELKKYIPVNVYGACEKLGSVGTQCKSNSENDLNCDDARKTMNSYKFYLAFENSNCEDYITEKVYKILSLNMKTVPIIMNGINHLDKILPPKSYIDVNTFSSAISLANYMLKLDNNDDMYNEYFAWRSTYRCILNWRPCTFCREFHKVHGRQNTSFTDVLAVFGKDNCEKPLHVLNRLQMFSH